jgi:hypothetical protein
MVPSVTKGGTQKLPPKFKIVETYRHDHSLESSWGALSDEFLGHLITYIQISSGSRNEFIKNWLNLPEYNEPGSTLLYSLKWRSYVKWKSEKIPNFVLYIDHTIVPYGTTGPPGSEAACRRPRHQTTPFLWRHIDRETTFTQCLFSNWKGKRT